MYYDVWTIYASFMLFLNITKYSVLFYLWIHLHVCVYPARSLSFFCAKHRPDRRQGIRHGSCGLNFVNSHLDLTFLYRLVDMLYECLLISYT